MTYPLSHSDLSPTSPDYHPHHDLSPISPDYQLDRVHALAEPQLRWDGVGEPTVAVRLVRAHQYPVSSRRLLHYVDVNLERQELRGQWKREKPSNDLLLNYDLSLLGWDTELCN